MMNCVLILTLLGAHLTSSLATESVGLAETSINDQSAINLGPIEYHASLTLLNGFTSIRGHVDILFRVAGTKLAGTSVLGSRLAETLAKFRGCNQCSKSDEIQYIELRSHRKLRLIEVSLSLSPNVKDVRRNKGTKVQVLETIPDPSQNLVKISCINCLEPGFYGRLSIAYSSVEETEYPETASDKTPINYIGPEQTDQLFPYLNCFKHMARSCNTKLRLTTHHEDINKFVLSNVPLGDDNHEALLMQVTTGNSLVKTEFKQAEPMDLNQLSLAFGPFYRWPLDTAQRRAKLIALYEVAPIIRPSQQELTTSTFAMSLIDRSLDWLRAKFPFKRELNKGDLLDESPQASPERTKRDVTDVKMVLAAALLATRRWFATKLPASFSLWLKEGLAAYYAIRMVRELEPKLAMSIVQFVNSELVQKAMKLDVDCQQKAITDNDENEADRLERVLLRLVKGATIINLLRGRVASISDETFDSRIWQALGKVSLSSKPDVAILADVLGSDQVTRSQMEQLLQSWTQSRGLPYVGVTIDARSRSVKLHQVPSCWFFKSNRGPNNDFSAAQWPMQIDVEFSSDSDRARTEVFAFDDANEPEAEIKLPEWFDPEKRGNKFRLTSGDQFNSFDYYLIGYAKTR